MLGAIAGDVIGSVYEFDNYKGTDFPLFQTSSVPTDDSVLTVATADKLLQGGDYSNAYRGFAVRYPNESYGGMFRQWITDSEQGPYNSFGNGSAMRVSPVAWAFDSLNEVLLEAKRSAEVTHNHPKGITGAQVTAAAIWSARQGATKDEIKDQILSLCDYDLERTLSEIRPVYTFNETCEATVPEAVIAFLESDGFEDAIRKAVSLGGDSDTLACITGSIAEAFYGSVPEEIAREGLSRLDPDLIKIVGEFDRQYLEGRYVNCFQQIR